MRVLLESASGALFQVAAVRARSCVRAHAHAISNLAGDAEVAQEAWSEA